MSLNNLKMAIPLVLAMTGCVDPNRDVAGLTCAQIEAEIARINDSGIDAPSIQTALPATAARIDRRNTLKAAKRAKNCD